MATLDRRGTVAVGRPLPIRSGQTSSTVALSGSRTVAGAATYNRSGAVVAANAPSGSRTITPLGITYARAGTLAVGRIPVDRSGAIALGHTLSGSRVAGPESGVQFIRFGLVMVGRIANTRSGTVTVATQLAATRSITPAGVFDRTGGKAGGAGRPLGLLLALQAHPGATLSASRSLGTTLPARSGMTVGSAVISGAQDTDRSRSATIVTVLAPSGSRAFSGNRNRNGMIIVQLAVAGSRELGRVNLGSGATIVSNVPSGARDVGTTAIYVRGGAVTISPVLSGGVLVRSTGGRTFIFQPITTGWVANPDEVVVG